MSWQALLGHLNTARFEDQCANTQADQFFKHHGRPFQPVHQDDGSIKKPAVDVKPSPLFKYAAEARCRTPCGLLWIVALGFGVIVATGLGGTVGDAVLA
jgi:hypothetical protein